MDVTEKYLIPLPGLSVHDPTTKNIMPAQGMIVSWIGPEGRYWRRRVADGTCTVGTPPEPEKAKVLTEDKKESFYKKGR